MSLEDPQVVDPIPSSSSESVAEPVPEPVPTVVVQEPVNVTIKSASGAYTFLYGIQGFNVVDVTSTAYTSCLKDNVITIPGGDEQRSGIFGVDPAFGYYKEVYIIDSAGTQTSYDVLLNVFVNIATNVITTTPLA
jgi:hypothetical protein